MAIGQNDIASANLTTTSATADGGLIISSTETIRKFLITASTDSNLSQDLRELATSSIKHPSVPYKSLKSIWLAADRQTRPDLGNLFSGSGFLFISPKPREKSAELQARLKKLNEAAERKEYDELVKDVTPRKIVEEPFSSYKDQFGFGLHVAVTMLTGYLVGFFAFRALFNHNPAMSAAGGILGLVGAMLVETLLFIITTSSKDVPSNSFTSRQKKNQ